MMDKHPNARVEAALHLAELVAQMGAVNGQVTVQGGVIRALISQVMRDAETIQVLNKTLEVAALTLKKVAEDAYMGDDEEGWD